MVLSTHEKWMIFDPFGMAVILFIRKYVQVFLF